MLTANHPPLHRGHPRKSKSSSALPHHPELDPTRRRSGIRHFSHVPSIHCKENTIPQKQRSASGTGKVKSKLRSVSAFTPMQFRNLFGSKPREPDPIAMGQFRQANTTPARTQQKTYFPQTGEEVLNARLRQKKALRMLMNR